MIKRKFFFIFSILMVAMTTGYVYSEEQKPELTEEEIVDTIEEVMFDEIDITDILKEELEEIKDNFPKDDDELAEEDAPLTLRDKLRLLLLLSRERRRELIIEHLSNNKLAYGIATSVVILIPVCIFTPKCCKTKIKK